MVFSSPTFIFVLLPLTLAGFFLVPRPLRTPLLITASLVFYTWGEKQLVAVLAISIVLNWAMALIVERTSHERWRRTVLIVAAALNIGTLLYFKYTNFVIANVSVVLQHLGQAPLRVTPVHLPIGVSFITFEALSYVVDVYRRQTRAARNPLHVALFMSSSRTSLPGRSCASATSPPP
jgi:alginate O-acetyltransferase complex protein AlgI